MRKKHPVAIFIAAFVIMAAGAVTLASMGSSSPATIDDDPVTASGPAADTFSYEGAVVEYVADVETFAAAVRVHEEKQRQAAAAVAAAKKKAAAAPKPSTPQPTASHEPLANSGGDEDFRACVMRRESGNNYASVGGGMYGIIDSTWRAMGYDDRFGVAHSWLASSAQQDAAYWDLYSRYGKKPWSPYNGCP